MRKIIVLGTIIILAIMLGGCGKETPSMQDAKSQTQQASNLNPQKTNPNNSSPGSTSIVAKSENVISSSDKEALLNQVDKELDSLLKNVNNLDDTQDSDLDLNQK